MRTIVSATHRWIVAALRCAGYAQQVDGVDLLGPSTLGTAPSQLSQSHRLIFLRRNATQNGRPIMRPIAHPWCDLTQYYCRTP
jgi:hypothetical protein